MLFNKKHIGGAVGGIIEVGTITRVNQLNKIRENYINTGGAGISPKIFSKPQITQYECDEVIKTLHTHQIKK